MHLGWLHAYAEAGEFLFFVDHNYFQRRVTFVQQVALDSTSNGTEKLITVNGKGALTLKYGGPVLGGPRVYLIEEDGVDKNYMLVINRMQALAIQ